MRPHRSHQEGSRGHASWAWEGEDEVMSGELRDAPIRAAAGGEPPTVTTPQDTSPEAGYSGDPLRDIPVGVIDRARTSRDALCRALGTDRKLRVIDRGPDAASALARDEAFGAVLFHVGAPVPGLLDDIKALAVQFPAAAIVVVASYVDADVTETRRTHGATDVLDNDAPLDQVVTAVAAASEVRHLRTVPGEPPASAQADELGITERELGVLRALSEGHSPQQIALDEGISVATVRDHLKHLRFKLDCASAVELVVTAHRSGLLPNLNRPLP
ncbi:hypothetical protein BH24ACT4_BH24ACT4_17480 [soil metagenome]